MSSPKQLIAYQKHKQREFQRTLGFPEGEGYIGNCPRCDEPVLVAYTSGLVQRLSTRSVPVRDAAVLRTYHYPVFAVWRTVMLRPVKFHVTSWELYPPRRPSKGSLHIWHQCRLRK